MNDAKARREVIAIIRSVMEPYQQRGMHYEYSARGAHQVDVWMKRDGIVRTVIVNARLGDARANANIRATVKRAARSLEEHTDAQRKSIARAMPPPADDPLQPVLGLDEPPSPPPDVFEAAPPAATEVQPQETPMTTEKPTPSIAKLKQDQLVKATVLMSRHLTENDDGTWSYSEGWSDARIIDEVDGKGYAVENLAGIRRRNFGPTAEEKAKLEPTTDRTTREVFKMLDGLADAVTKLAKRIEALEDVATSAHSTYVNGKGAPV